MEIQKYHWSLYSPIPADIQQELQIFPPVLRQLLYNRGISSQRKAESYLDAELPEDIKTSQLLGIKSGADRIQDAIQGGKHIAIYGDFDADGLTATTIMKSSLLALDAQVSTYIPHRTNEGYGLNPDAIQGLRQSGAELLITVDCGIRAVEEVRLAKEIGLEVIVTDHHQPGNDLPDADVIVNPNQPHDTYPNKDLAGVGVAYKLISSLFDSYSHLDPDQSYLDLVAVGTIADLVPLRGENRHIVRRGLGQLRSPRRQGILSLMGVAGIPPKSIRASHVSYQLAPRLNATGRLATANYALDLLLEEDVHRAGRLAQEIEIYNNRRKELMGFLKEKADRIAVPEDDEVPPILFAFHQDFNQGIVGLAAGHLAEKYHRPAVVGRKEDSLTVASCRSIDAFNIIAALEHHQDLFIQFGGHPSAAGFTIENENIPELTQQMTQYSYQALKNIDLQPKMKADMEIGLGSLDYELLDTMQGLCPLGIGNPQPVFISRHVSAKNTRQVGRQKNHLKLKVSDGNYTFDAIAFGKGELHGELPPRMDILYTFEENEFRGHSSLQLNIKDFRPSQ